LEIGREGNRVKERSREGWELGRERDVKGTVGQRGKGKGTRRMVNSSHRKIV